MGYPPTNAVNAFKKIKVIRDEAVIKELTASDTSFNDTELSDCQKVKYKIASSNLCGDTESDPRETSIKPFIRDPRITASEGTSPSNVSLNWIDVDFEKGYDLFRNGDLIFKAAADLNFYKDEDAVPGEIYEYCVKGYSSCTESVLSCAHGYRNPNGTVTGNVKTEFGGFAVEGVEMKVTPVQDNSKKFDGNSHIDIKIDQWPK